MGTKQTMMMMSKLYGRGRGTNPSPREEELLRILEQDEKEINKLVESKVERIANRVTKESRMWGFARV